MEFLHHGKDVIYSIIEFAQFTDSSNNSTMSKESLKFSNLSST